MGCNGDDLGEANNFAGIPNSLGRNGGTRCNPIQAVTGRRRGGMMMIIRRKKRWRRRRRRKINWKLAPGAWNLDVKVR